MLNEYENSLKNAEVKLSRGFKQGKIKMMKIIFILRVKYEVFKVFTEFKNAI